MSKLTRSPAWQALAAHQRRIAAASLRELFAADASRAGRFSLEAGGLLLDYSKHRIDAETMRLLRELAAQAQVPAWIDQMRRFVDEAQRGALKGVGGLPITDIVNIGIGGSDLGPRMLARALRKFRKPGPRLHFVANIDPADLDSALADLDPGTTFFIVASKSFTTAETLDNAARARAWLESALGESIELSRHFAAVTANAAGAAALGIPAERVFPLWDWVGGRYSVWSAVGLPVALTAGMDAFEELLEGARAMDEHFRTAPLERNLPVVLALLEIWYVNFFGARSRAVIPYSEDLRDLPAYLQQLEMESNGKRVDRDGYEVDYETAPCRQCARPELGARLRQPRAGRAAQGPARQPPLEHPAPRAPHPALTRRADRAVRAQGFRRGHDLELEQLRPVGGRARQESRSRAAQGRKIHRARFFHPAAARAHARARLTRAAAGLTLTETENTMNEDTFNLSIRKFLKMVGVSSQREIEQAVAKAHAGGAIRGNEKFPASVTLEVPGLKLSVKFDGRIELE